MDAVSSARELRRELSRLRFGPPVAAVYNPLEYAWEPHRLYLERYASTPREVLLLGMNPGPWGMAQTGVPFGEVSLVRGWLGVEGPVGQPRAAHPKRPVSGFACVRREVSGSRLWGWARDRFGTPERFFARFFIANYCPLLFIGEAGENLTPDKLPARQRAPLLAACDGALRALVRALRPHWVVGIGAFASARAREALAGLEIEVAGIPHPSPANPQANKGWAKLAEAALQRAGIL